MVKCMLFHDGRGIGGVVVVVGMIIWYSRVAVIITKNYIFLCLSICGVGSGGGVNIDCCASSLVQHHNHHHHHHHHRHKKNTTPTTTTFTIVLLQLSL